MAGSGVALVMVHRDGIMQSRSRWSVRHGRVRRFGTGFGGYAIILVGCAIQIAVLHVS